MAAAIIDAVAVRRAARDLHRDLTAPHRMLEAPPAAALKSIEGARSILGDVD